MAVSCSRFLMKKMRRKKTKKEEGYSKGQEEESEDVMEGKGEEEKTERSRGSNVLRLGDKRAVN